MVKLTVKGIKKGAAVVSEVTLREVRVDIPGEVSGTKGLATDVLKVAAVSAMMGPEPVAVVSGVVVFRIAVGLDPSL